MASHSSLILVINCGSSSLKFALIAEGDPNALLSGLAENLGQDESRLTIKENGEKVTVSLDGGAHDGALKTLMGLLDERGYLKSVVAVGHRVVHGGERFTSSTLIDDAALAGLESVTHLAPLHNPANILGIRTALEVLPSVPHVAVFDTAFHMTMPKEAFFYAIPRNLYSDYGVRRYGFHGTSHRFVAEEAVRQLGLDPQDHGIVIAHLGNGASATAVLNGQSVDTTMGMTPLEGLVMGTRSGDIDPGAIFHIAREAGLDIDGLDTLLNRKSGLLGLSGLSNDCRTLESAAMDGNADAQLALDVFVHRLARHIGGLTTSLPRLDAVVFTGGIGENSVWVREATIKRLAALGLKLDAEANSKMFAGRSGIISPEGVKPVSIVIATNEEWMIARDTQDIAGKAQRA